MRTLGSEAGPSEASAARHSVPYIYVSSSLVCGEYKRTASALVLSLTNCSLYRGSCAFECGESSGEPSRVTNMTTGGGKQ